MFLMHIPRNCKGWYLGMYVYLVSDFVKLADVNIFEWTLTGLMIIAAVIGGYKIISEFCALINKPIGLARQRKEDHELIIKNSEAIKALADLHKKDCENATANSDKLRDNLNVFMTEVRSDIKTFTDNRVSDREKSREIQNELRDSINAIVDKNVVRDTQINSLIVAQKEMMAEKINSKYKYYLSINGIPEDEYDEFVSLHAGYKAVGGNSHGDAKFEYCINHLPVIPVETKLVVKHEQ